MLLNLYQNFFLKNTLLLTLFGVFSSLLLVISEPVYSATLIELDSQEQIRNQEREDILLQEFQANPDVRLYTPLEEADSKIPEQEYPCFIVNEILLANISETSKKSVPQFDFSWALDSVGQLSDGTPDIALGRCLGSSGINLVMKRVQNTIVNEGFITTRIVVAPQDLKTGILKLTVVPGRIRDIRFSDPKNYRATVWNAIPAGVGELLNLRDIEQALENFKRVPTAEADIKINPSSTPDSQPGDSDLVIDWKQDFPFRLNLSFDDSGSDATGKYQGGLTLSFDHWWTLNDLFYISFNNDLGGGYTGKRGSNGQTIHYSLPFGYWLFAVTTSSNQYHQIVVGATEDYIYSGESNNQEIKVSRMVYRDAVRKTNVSLRGWRRDSKNFIDDTEVIVQRRSTVGWEFGVAHQEFIANGSLNVGINYRRGVDGYGSLPAPEEAFGEGTSLADILTSQIQLNMPFKLGDHNLSYSGVLKGQADGTRLVPQDRFSIGGRYTVRGFDGGSQLSAERGWLSRNELNIALGQTGQAVYVGLDYGSVSGPTSNNLIGTALSGGVIGLRGKYKAFSYDLFFGKPITKPNKFIVSESVSGFSINGSF